MKLRTLMGIGLAFALTLLQPAVVLAQGTKIRIGYLHTLAVDGQLWIAESQGLWKKEGLEPEFIKFQTGLELFQAMTGGSIDVLSTGAVLSNFPARGQGKVFLINDIEFATAQLWGNPEMGVSAMSDLPGKKLATTTGTTAHVFLDTALRANSIDPKSVDIVNQRMPDAVTAFISKAVPAVVLWMPFNISVRNKMPGAKMIVDASAYYPKSAIVDGWAARNDYYDKNKETLAKVVRVWASANDYMIRNPDQAIATLQKDYYQEVPVADLKAQLGAQKMFTSAEWAKMYADGTVTQWLQKVTDFFADFAKIQNPVPAAKYFDPAIYLGVVKP